MYCNGSTLTCAVLMSARIFLENYLTEREELENGKLFNVR